MKKRLVVAGITMGLAIGGAHASSPVDADDFIQQNAAPLGSLPTIPSQTDALTQQLMKQALGTSLPVQAGATAQQPPAPQPMWALGVFNIPCKSLSNPVTHNLNVEAVAWTQGYWTGLNTLNQRNHNVGKNSDIKAMIADIAQRCTDAPQETLMNVVSNAYAQYQKDGK